MLIIPGTYDGHQLRLYVEHEGSAYVVSCRVKELQEYLNEVVLNMSGEAFQLILKCVLFPDLGHELNGQLMSVICLRFGMPVTITRQ